MPLVLFCPMIVMYVHRPIPVGCCCSFIILGEMNGVESIVTLPGLCTLFHGTDDIAVINLLLFHFFFKFCNFVILLLDDSSLCWFLLDMQCRC